MPLWVSRWERRWARCSAWWLETSASGLRRRRDRRIDRRLVPAQDNGMSAMRAGPSCARTEEAGMTTNRRLGTAITRVTPVGSAIGVVVGYLNITSAVGVAVVGILIGTGVARGAFSTAPNTKRNG